MRLETDVAGKSDRVEWGHTRYQTVFRSDQAYELVIEWLTSSGSIVFELVSVADMTSACLKHRIYHLLLISVFSDFQI